MKNNIEFSYDWLLQELIRTDFTEKQNNKKIYYKISKVELLKMFITFVKLNERGD